MVVLKRAAAVPRSREASWSACGEAERSRRFRALSGGQSDWSPRARPADEKRWQATALQDADATAVAILMSSSLRVLVSLR